MFSLDAYFNGQSVDGYQYFGAHLDNGGVLFRVYAPAARSVKIIGDFNEWNGDSHVMDKIDERGIYQLWIDQIGEWTLYKYHIQSSEGKWIEKSDPYGFFQELRPKNASLVVDLEHYSWQDQGWMNKRSKNEDKPLNIYELHLGSWKKRNFHEWLTYPEIARELVPYCHEFGFTHIEIMPLNEYPFDGSWGYQATGFFSLTSRYGTPKQFMEMVDLLHQANIGVILDVVPSHFVKDQHGLAQFDGQALYEYPREADAHSEWGTYYFNYWSEHVRSFMMSSEGFWCAQYHIDGLRLDAISNLIFWGGQKDRGINQGAIYFLKRMNDTLAKAYPEVMLIAEDSSDYPGVCAPTFENGLGFDYKWDLGWMNDTLSYYGLDPTYRKAHHHDLTFSMAYFNNERFILPLSHDEMVHGKKTIIDKMWGNYEQKFAQVKNLYLYMMSHPGKKLNFMGNELAHFREWDENKEMDWFLMKYPQHQSFVRFFRDCSRIYGHTESFTHDFSTDNFQWIDADNADQSIYAYVRKYQEEIIVCVFNMSSSSYENYRIGVPGKGTYAELINSEKDIYNGCNMLNYKPLVSEKMKAHGFADSIRIAIAPFAGMYFKRIVKGK